MWRRYLKQGAVMNEILCEGDSCQVLDSLLEKGVTWDYCVTSPPYWGQIDYCHTAQYGLEPTVEEYIQTQRHVFRRVYRGLISGGVAWIVIGDTSNNYSPVRAKGQRRIPNTWHHRRNIQRGYREKETLSVPYRLAAAMREDGWIHRATLIWNKGQSSQPHKSDAPGSCHEYILMMGKDTSSNGRPYLNTYPLKSSVLTHAPAKGSTHPCPFPYSLVQELLSSCTRRGVILDPYLGSGTTLQVCRQLYLDFVGIDLSIPNLNLELLPLP